MAPQTTAGFYLRQQQDSSSEAITSSTEPETGRKQQFLSLLPLQGQTLPVQSSHAAIAAIEW